MKNSSFYNVPVFVYSKIYQMEMNSPFSSLCQLSMVVEQYFIFCWIFQILTTSFWSHCTVMLLKVFDLNFKVSCDPPDVSKGSVAVTLALVTWHWLMSAPVLTTALHCTALHWAKHSRHLLGYFPFIHLPRNLTLLNNNVVLHAIWSPYKTQHMLMCVCLTKEEEVIKHTKKIIYSEKALEST